jgi:hypothetical protein
MLSIPVLDEDGRVQKIPSHSDELPWMAILNPDGITLCTSDSADGNIGYPAGKKRVAHFEKMIRETAQKLTAAEIQSLIKGLAANAPTN